MMIARRLQRTRGGPRLFTRLRVPSPDRQRPKPLSFRSRPRPRLPRRSLRRASLACPLSRLRAAGEAAATKAVVPPPTPRPPHPGKPRPALRPPPARSALAALAAAATPLVHRAALVSAPSPARRMGAEAPPADRIPEAERKEAFPPAPAADREEGITAATGRVKASGPVLARTAAPAAMRAGIGGRCSRVLPPMTLRSG